MNLFPTGNIINHLYATNPYDGRSPIHRAVECTEKNAGLTIVNLLLKTDSEIANLQDRDGFSPLHLACQLDRKKIVKKLLVSCFFHRIDCFLPIFLSLNKVTHCPTELISTGLSSTVVMVIIVGCRAVCVLMTMTDQDFASVQVV